MDSIQQRKLGQIIQQKRLEHGLSQDELSDKAGLAYSTLAKIEQGAIKNPSVFTIAEIASVLGVKIEELVSGHAAHQAHTDVRSEIKFVYCDINGVMVRFYQGAFAEAAKQAQVSPEIVESAFWHYNDAVCRGEMSMDELNHVLAKRIRLTKLDWEEYYFNAIQPIKAMQEYLARVAERMPVGLLSNIYPGFIDRMLKEGYLPDIDYATIIDSSVVGAIKPEARIFEIAEEKSGYHGREILFIDDSRANLIAADRMDWHVMWFDDYRPDASVRRIKQTLH